MGSLATMMLCAIAVCFLAPVNIESKAIRQRREEVEVCTYTQPCGFEVFKPFERTIEYFLKYPCDCRPDHHCVRTYEDVSISAYVHRCRPENETVRVWPYSLRRRT